MKRDSLVEEWQSVLFETRRIPPAMNRISSLFRFPPEQSMKLRAELWLNFGPSDADDLDGVYSGNIKSTGGTRCTLAVTDIRDQLNNLVGVETAAYIHETMLKGSSRTL